MDFIKGKLFWVYEEKRNQVVENMIEKYLLQLDLNLVMV